MSIGPVPNVHSRPIQPHAYFKSHSGADTAGRRSPCRRHFRRTMPDTTARGRAVIMKAVVFQGEGRLEIRDFPDPVPGPDEVVIRMKASGMCGSDLHHLHGPLRTGPELVIEGHEPCGVVELVGDAVRPTEARVGDATAKVTEPVATPAGTM